MSRSRSRLPHVCKQLLSDTDLTQLQIQGVKERAISSQIYQLPAKKRAPWYTFSARNLKDSLRRILLCVTLWRRDNKFVSKNVLEINNNLRLEDQNYNYIHNIGCRSLYKQNCGGAGFRELRKVLDGEYFLQL